MICPSCGYKNTKVYDSRTTRGGKVVRRRRECPKCNYRFTSIEEVKVIDLMVEKRNGQVITFSQEKLEKGIRKAFNKRRVDNQKISKIVQKVIEDILRTGKNPIRSTKIGKIVLKNLRAYDEAAYVCFWAMYGNFETAEEFDRLLKAFQKE